MVSMVELNEWEDVLADLDREVRHLEQLADDSVGGDRAIAQYRLSAMRFAYGSVLKRIRQMKQEPRP